MGIPNDLANTTNLTGTFDIVKERTLLDIDKCIPAKIVSYDRQTHRASVQPQIMLMDNNTAAYSRAPIISVPVLSLGGGSFVIDFPINAGDIGWLFASDQDTSLFLQSLNEAKPATGRIHDFSSAVFIPHVLTRFNIDDDDKNNLVIQKTDGTVKISLSEKNVTIKADNLLLETDNIDITKDTVNFKTTSVTHQGNNIGLTHVHGAGSYMAGNDSVTGDSGAPS